MVTPIDPTATGFLLAETRTQPMHVGALQLFEKPEGAGRSYVRELYESMRACDTIDEIAPLFLKHPTRSLRTAGQWVWEVDELFDIDHHVRHSALPKPGRVRELLDLVSRLHGTRLARERPLWEAHLIEGLRDGRVAFYTKTHHALVDGVSAMRLLAKAMSEDPDERGMPAMWANRSPSSGTSGSREQADPVTLSQLPMQVVRGALAISAEAGGMPSALVTTLRRGLSNETSAVSLYAPRTILNGPITGSRRFAAQDWPLERLRAIGKTTGTTINDVVLAMCSGALRAYLLGLDALPDTGLIAMVPVGLKAKESQLASPEGGNAVGSVMVQLSTELADPADRLRRIHHSMRDGKQALSSMTPMQIQAMSALGQVPAVLPSLFRASGILRPPYNVVISNVPGPRTPLYLAGATVLGYYPVSVVADGQGLNLTVQSYQDNLDIGLVSCRELVPDLWDLLGYLTDAIDELHDAATRHTA